VTTTRRRPGRPPRGAPVADRDAIVAAAEAAISREGSGVSLDAIAAEAGVTKPVLYAKVGDRAALADELATRLTDRMIEAAAGTVDAAGPDLDGLTALFRSALDTIDAHRELFLYVTHGQAASATERLFLAARSAEPLAAQFARWRGDRGHDETVAVPWAYGIVGMLNMVALWWLEDRSRPSDVVAAQLAELVFPGLAD
jgi:AcrR family transcriptional regulator